MDEQNLVMEHPLFLLLPESARADLVVNGSLQTFHDGDVIIVEDAPNPSLFLICSGQAQVLMNGTKVGEIHANDVVGEISAAGISPPTATVLAVGTVTLYAFPAGNISQLAIRYPEFAAALKESGLKKAYG